MVGPHQLGLYTNKAFLNHDNVKEIIQSSVYLADCIYLPASIRAVPTLDEIHQRDIHTKLLQLHEIGAIKFWDVEGLTLFLTKEMPSTKFPLDTTIPRETYREIYDKVIDRLISNRAHFLKAESAPTVEGIAEIVRGKHVLWTFALKDYFQASDILLDAANARSNQLFFQQLLGSSIVSTTQDVLNAVSMRLNIPDVSQLNISQIEACRKFMPTFRDDLLAKIKMGGDSQLDRAEVVKKTADAIVTNFIEYILKKSLSGQQGSQQTSDGSKWTLKQLMFPQEVGANKERFFKWEDKNDAMAPAMLLWKIVSESS